MSKPDARQSWHAESQALHLYRILQEIETDPARRRLFSDLADEAAAQVAVWARALQLSDSQVAPASRTTALLGWLLRRIGVRPLLPALAAAKVRGLSAYRGGTPGHPMPTALGPEPGRHRGIGASGSLRAAVFGINDGLLSSASLVLGMAGASDDARLVLLAGLAGMLAGAFSMASGEYVSVASQRELFENQIALEREELRLYPAEEAEELALIYAARGLDLAEARQLATRLIAHPEHALDTLAREELGLNPDELGSPVGAAVSSFASFAAGAVLPLLPYLCHLQTPLGWTIGLTVVSLFGIGAGLSLFTGRNPLWSGLRMLLIGVAAGGVTYTVGRLLGVSIS
jgi:VIT1/CCC1 family predicted Fe2+/Mn2+ transporter